MDLELTGKVVLITGGTDGLGLALATRLVDEGAAVAICGRDEARLGAAADTRITSPRQRGDRTTTIPLRKSATGRCTEGDGG